MGNITLIQAILCGVVYWLAVGNLPFVGLWSLQRPLVCGALTGLIHGQVVSGWIPKYRVNALMIIDDELAQDRLIRRVLTASVPRTISLEILTTESAAINLQKEPEKEKERTA